MVRASSTAEHLQHGAERRRGRPARYARRDQPEGRPENGGVEHQRKRKVDRQTVRLDSSPVGKEAGCNHEPANRALQSTEQKDQEQPWAQPSLDLSGCPEPAERDQKRDPDQPPPQSVKPLQPEYLPEAVERQSVMQQSILRYLPIQREQLLPPGMIKRWENPTERSPFHDRKAGPGEAGDPTKNDHGQDHAANRKQPPGHEPTISAAGARLPGGAPGNSRRSKGMHHVIRHAAGGGSLR